MRARERGPAGVTVRTGGSAGILEGLRGQRDQSRHGELRADHTRSCGGLAPRMDGSVECRTPRSPAGSDRTVDAGRASPASAAPATYAVTVNAGGTVPVHTASAQASYVVTIPCGPAVPRVSAAPLVQSSAPGTRVNFSITVQNLDSSSCAAATFSMRTTLLSGWTGLLVRQR